MLRTASQWDRGSGAAVLIAETQERVQDLLREYEFEDSLTVYTDDSEAEADVTGPTRHTWVEVERFPTTEQRERIVYVAWDEKI